MNIIEQRADPAIIDFEAPALSVIDFDKIYDHPLVAHTYNTLIVNPGRYDMPNGTPEHAKLNSVLNDTMYEVIKKLTSMDQIRWPILDLGYVDFDDFYTKKIKTAIEHKGLYIMAMVCQPGFSMPWHLDNRFSMLSGIINVNDNETQTCFTTTSQASWDHSTKSPKPDTPIIHRGTKNKFQGTAWLNTELTWHCVPKVTVERKIVLFGVQLR
jgi:hypothetical protein